MDKISAPMKAFFFFTGIVLWLGIWLTGLDDAHWVLFLPATFFLISAITGICPGLSLFTSLFREEEARDID